MIREIRGGAGLFSTPALQSRRHPLEHPLCRFVCVLWAVPLAGGSRPRLRTDLLCLSAACCCNINFNIWVVGWCVGKAGVQPSCSHQPIQNSDGRYHEIPLSRLLNGCRARLRKKHPTSTTVSLWQHRGWLPGIRSDIPPEDSWLADPYHIEVSPVSRLRGHQLHHCHT